MSQLVMLTFRLFGPHRGATMVINGHRFVKGLYELAQQSDNIGPVMQVLKYYGAYAGGTPEYKEALAKEQAEDEANGASEIHPAAESGEADALLSDVRQAGGESTETSPVHGSADADTGSGDSGAGASGDGHEHPRIPKFEEAKDQREPTEPSSEVNENLKGAILKLDPQENSHWVMTGGRKGKPKLAAVETAYGKAGLTIHDVETALPGWDRDQASERLIEAG